MSKTSIAVIAFPGTNNEVESLRAVSSAGMEAIAFKWNDPVKSIEDCDGYFLAGGFSYEDRGRAGMVSARDPLMDFLRSQARDGKVVLGHCNGAQILVESGLIPLGTGLAMSLARNALQGKACGFLNEWIWITPSCDRSRCAASDWEGAMHIPIAHGEGRFTTKDPGLLKELIDADQLAFSYSDSEGNAAPTAEFNPNGSEIAIAGLCNPEGNVIALMPHPERTQNGQPYFASMKKWIESERKAQTAQRAQKTGSIEVGERSAKPLEIFIETIITNNEERTVEQAAQRVVDSVTLKQMKYLAPSSGSADAILSDITLFNPNKETAVLRRDGKMFRWNSDSKKEEALSDDICEGAIGLLRRDEPDTGAAALGEGSETGVCYLCSGVDESALSNAALLEVFFNPHASTLERLR